MAMILRSYSHLRDWGVGVVCSIPAAGLTQWRGQQNAAESTCWGGSPSGAPRDCVFCSRYPTAMKLPIQGKPTG